MIVNNAIIVNDTLWSHFICSTSDRLEAETLQLRRLKSDLTVMFSIIRGFVDIDCNSLFRVIDCESVHTRGHNLRLCKEHCNVNCRLNAFARRNIDVWNRLPVHVVNSDGVAVVKHRLACLNISQFLLHGCLKGNLCVVHV